MTPFGRAFVEAFEGLVLKAAPDCVGVLTIGYGHTNLGNIPPHVSPGDVWTKAQADQALSNDLARFDAHVTEILPELKQYEHDALASFDFNTGDLARSSIPARLRAGDVKGAMDTLLQYCHAAGKVLPGLVRRRRAERLMFLGQIDQALELAGAQLAGRGGPPATGGIAVPGDNAPMPA
jgi:lysozyme